MDIRKKLTRSRGWKPSESEQQRLSLAMLKLAKDPDSAFHTIWGINHHGLSVSVKGGHSPRWFIPWEKALELTNEASRRAEAAEKKTVEREAGVVRIDRVG